MTLILRWPKKTASEHFIPRELIFTQMLSRCRWQVSTGRDTLETDFAWNPVRFGRIQCELTRPQSRQMYSTWLTQ